MTRELDPELLNRLLANAPGAYQGDPVLDNGSFADNTANVCEPASEGLMLSIENERWHQAHPHGAPADSSEFEREHGVLGQFLLATGERHADDPERVQPGGLVAVPKPGGGYTAVPRALAAEHRAAVNLARPAPPMSAADAADLELRQARAGGWLLSDDERSRLYDGRGDPSREMQAGWED